MSDAIEKAVAQLRIRRDELIATGGGIAGVIAKAIGRSFPLIYGAAGIGAVAARRWKTQVNENAKAPAFFGIQPEICHNEICGFGQSGDVTRQLITLCQLRSDFEHPRIDARFTLMGQALRETVSTILEVHANGEGPLAQLLDLIFIGDFVSLHLAVNEGIDPGPVPILVGLKRDLAAWQG
jgi:glucose/mannose-6-phosphate isomerase